MCSIFQRYNSKAIHNDKGKANFLSAVVLNISKIQFKSNSQRFQIRQWTSFCCAQYFKDTIQKQFTTQFDELIKIFLLCSIFQRYNSKAIHNAGQQSPHGWAVVLNISKIQFKSNSQPIRLATVAGHCCAQYFKDTIQKQFTTSPWT